MVTSANTSVAGGTTTTEHNEDPVSSGIQQNFWNLDDGADVDHLIHTVQSSSTRNFVLDFGDDEAWAAFDVSPTLIASLTATDRPRGLSTRWINIWYPFQQRETLELLARRYDFSPRLLALMCSDPKRRRALHENKDQHYTPPRHVWSRQSKQPYAESELEKGSDELSDLCSISSRDSITRGNLYNIVDEIWHYSSVDFGRSYICLGYNSLYGTKNSGGLAGNGHLPYCTRVWTWLLLCGDGTIISITEDPFPNADGRLNELQQRIVTETRRNLVNVFRSLSAVDNNPLVASNPMTLLPIRARLGNTTQETAHRNSDAPALLFYYLFENWHNSYTLVTRKESRYGVELNKLRKEMFEAPKLCHIDRLDSFGKELGILRKHYASYNRIIDRLLEPRNVTLASLENSQVVSEASQASLDTIRPLVTEKESMLGVSISSAARVRFSRLRDLIELYALSEVEEYLKQKESLVAMNFSLIAIKESLDVERLTRITLLLTKMSMLFLPVSLLTTYFSAPLSNAEYSVQQYWISFAVVLFLSLFALFVFGVFSGTMQTVLFTETWKGMKRGWAWFEGCARQL